MAKLKKGDKDSETLAGLTDEMTLARLRTAVQPPGKKGTWLRYLNDKRLSETYQLLKMGVTPIQIAKKAQKSWNMMLDSSPKSLARAVKQFADEVLSGDLVAAPEATTEEKDALKTLRKKGRRILDSFDALGTMRWALNEQANRYQMLREKENQMKLPLKMTEKTYKELREGLKDYLELAIRLGILDSKPSEFNLNFKHTLEGVRDSVLTNDGQKMIEAANELVNRIEQDAILMDMQDDGTYALVEKEESAVETVPVGQK